MTKLVAVLTLVGIASAAFAQSFTEGFEDLSDVNISPLITRGWAESNKSNPLGATDWFAGQPTTFAAHGGSGYIAANFQNTAATGTISDWLFTPTRTLRNSDTFSFWSRSAGTFADRMEVRLSTNGSSTNVGSTESSVGDFTTVVKTINGTLTTSGYPTTWTKYNIGLTGLAASGVSGRLAFRYYVTDAGAGGTNSNYIGVDDVAYVSSVPEPATLVVFGFAAVGAALRRRRSK